MLIYYQAYNDCVPYEVKQDWLQSSSGIRFEQNFWKDCVDEIEKAAPGTLRGSK